MKKYLVALLLAIMSGCYLYAGEKLLPRRDSLVYGHLDNGLTYYIYPHSYPKGEAVYRLFVKSGSLNEEDSQRGLAHFLEHLAFNGTEHFPGGEMVKYLERNGAKFGTDLNAYTTFGETVFKLQLPCSDLSKVDTTMSVLEDWAEGLSFAPEEVEKERGVILSEWLQRRDSRQRSNERLIMEMMNGSRFSTRMTIGDTAIIRHCTPKDIQDYYHRWYRPSLMAIAVVGDVDPTYIEKQIRTRFASLDPVYRPKAKHYTIPEYRKAETSVYYDPALNDITVDFLQLGKMTPAVRKPSDYKAYLILGLLNRLCKQRFANLAFRNPSYSNGSIQMDNILGGALIMDCSVNLESGKSVAGLKEYVGQCERIFRYGFTNVEIEQVKRTLLRSFRNRLKDPHSITSENLMEEIHTDFVDGDRFISGQEEYDLIQKYLPQIDSALLADRLQDVYNPRKMHTLLRAPESFRQELGEAPDVERIVEQARSAPQKHYSLDFTVPDQLCEMPTAGKIVSEKFIPQLSAWDWSLGNGARVIFRPSGLSRDQVSVSGFRRGGLYALDSLDFYTGLFAGSIIPISGAGDFTREALNFYLADNTASMRILVDKTRTGVMGSSNVQDLQTQFQLLYLKWTRPCLDTALCHQIISKTVDSYRYDVLTPESVFSRELAWRMSGKNYTNAVLTDTLILEKVKEDRMLDVFRRMYGSADGYTFIITGDTDTAAVKPLVREYLGGLPGGPVDQRYRYEERNIPHKDITFERHTGSTPRANVSLIFQNDQQPSISMNVLDIRQGIMSDIIRNILLDKLREQMGKVYSVSVQGASGKYPSFLSREIISFVCKSEDVDTLIDETVHQLRKTAEDPSYIGGVLPDVKANLLKEQKINLQKNTYYTTLLRNSIFNDEEDWNFMNEYESIVGGITASDISLEVKQMLETPFVKAVLYPKDS